MSLLPVEDAIARIVGDVSAPLGSEEVALGEAAGRTLARDLAARRSQPPFAASAMDGYAVRAVDVARGLRLKVIGVAAAGHSFAGKVSEGETVRIFTGAPVPEGADTVLIQEDAEVVGEATIMAQKPVASGRHIRRAGLDFELGTTLLAAGTLLGPREVSLIASMGHAAVPVRRRPRVAIIATGDELVPPGTMPGPDQIIASNAVAIAALARDAGGEPFDLGIVGDTEDAIADAVARASRLPADVLVTIGGASVGDHDLVRDVLQANGMALDFWRIAMRPGKPLMFGRLGDQKVLGLPGNPVSSFVCGLLFLRPLVAALLGRRYADPTEAAVLAADVAGNDSRQDYVRATYRAHEAGVPSVIPLPVQDSAMVSVLTEANCLLIRPPHADAARAGAPCRIIRLR
ncbi:MAG: molybdopterin molybdotransferase MoeA [Bauldia sp.]|uniref:molybdopterin molybdotransferase MoeA n=1 Tax=Bauldia sp. TaxID=2575872 RepID=UPI001DF46CFA|nr:gephyrin-like molybdotransferase Glp [Bauldia sp.]MCB1495709.1 molybdopterin molybdotransferase MoeA [Bauldia sp.]